MKIDLSKKAALITGSESGIGRAIAERFADLGCNLILTYLLNKQQGLITLDNVKNKGVSAILVQSDVSNEKNVVNLFKNGIDEFGKIDFLINCAGIRSFDKSIFDLTFSEFDLTMKSNLNSVFLCCKEFVKLFSKNQQNGRIVNITSIHSEVISAGKVDYCASKFAIKGLSKVIALELADKQITVNCIAPGMILTPMNQRAIYDSEYRQALEQRIPLGYAGQAKDVADTAAFLVSDYAKYITGTTQIIDGGLILNRSKGSN